MDGQTPAAGIHPENYRLLVEHVYANAGIVLGDDKHYLLETRLAPIVRQRGLGSVNELCAILRANGNTEAGRQITEAMTTNETYFFRDPTHYEAIRTILLPRLREERRDTKKLRFWSSAASTGQEAYSLAMVLIEEGFADWNVQILGTDFSTQVLERARSGDYRQLEVNRGLRAALLVKHFRRSGVDWQLNDPVRRMVHFETIDLRASMCGLGPFDLVFCRNVTIYFDPPTKKKVLKEIHRTLFRGGWLFLGGAETVFGIEEWFDRETVAGATVYIAR